MPLTFSGIDPGIRRHAPLHGEHTSEVLAELGFGEAEIGALRARKVVG
jgi:crotonobetainyl-CoA:carnitine CoA-transferase CaiB-like acyl-CoA transferase